MKLLFLALCLSIPHISLSEQPKEGTRDKKLFSLFSIVTFRNQGCASLDSTRNGTCYTSTECINKNGMASGNCAAGFGVCCLFLVSEVSTVINENCTYIRNPGFPSVYSATNALTYMIQKCSNDVCSVRLDFLTFNTGGPQDGNEDGANHLCQDSFVASGSSGISSPVICGLNTGEHIYVEMGAANSDAASLQFSWGAAASTIRNFEIKATQIPCGAQYGAPPGCLQYHTTLTGTITTFNWQNTNPVQHLANQRYDICIREQEGYCCVGYSLCNDPMAWQIDQSNIQKSKTVCTADYLEIEGATGMCQGSPGNTVIFSRFCTKFFNVVDESTMNAGEVCDCHPPFTATIKTDDAKDLAGAVNDMNKGLCLNYRLIAC